MPEIHSIVYKPESAGIDREDAYTRVPMQQVTLRIGWGIVGDRKGGHPDRQLNIMCLETLKSLHSEGFKTEPGAMGEQIIVKGVELVDLLPGTIVQFGATARIEVTKPRTGCERFERIQGLSPALAQRRMGVLARVVQDGEITIGDHVYVV